MRRDALALPSQDEIGKELENSLLRRPIKSDVLTRAAVRRASGQASSVSAVQLPEARRPRGSASSTSPHQPRFASMVTAVLSLHGRHCVDRLLCRIVEAMFNESVGLFVQIVEIKLDAARLSEKEAV